MAATSNGIGAAMDRIAAILGNGASSAGVQSPANPQPPASPQYPGNTPLPTSITSPPDVTLPTPISPPASSTPQPLSPEQQQAIASQIYYSMMVPLITQPELLDMERQLPDLVASLRTLPSRPAANAQLTALIDAIKPGNQSSGRSDGDQAAP